MEQNRIAGAAMPLLEGAESVFFDEGAPVAAVAEELVVHRPLTAVTASVPAATRLAGRPNVQVILLGGRLRPGTLGCVDHWALRMLEELVVDVALLSADGITPERGLTCADTSVAAIKAGAIAASRRRVLLADRKRFGTDAFCRFGALSDLSAVVTDGPDGQGDHRDAAREAGVEVLTA